MAHGISLRSRSYRSSSVNFRRCGLLSALAACSVFNAACTSLDTSEAQDTAEPEGQAEQSIHAGTPLSTTSARWSGVVRLAINRQNGWLGTCTGVLLTPQWVLTAAHCFERVYDANGDGELDAEGVRRVTVILGNQDDPQAQQLSVTRVVREPNAIFGTDHEFSTDDNDLALVRLSSNADVSKLLPGHFTPEGRLAIYPHDSATLGRAQTLLQGYGYNECRTGSGGSGFLRESRLPISHDLGQMIVFNAPSTIGLPCPGDSGGPTFYEDYSVIPGSPGVLEIRARYLVGINSGGDSRFAYATSNGLHEGWVEETVFGEAPRAGVDCTDSGLGASCSTWPAALPNNLAVTTALVPRTANRNQCYYVSGTYDMEAYNDYVKLAGRTLTRAGTYGSHYCGALPVRITSDASGASAGLRLNAQHYTTPYAALPGGAAAANSYAGTPGQWSGCRGNGVSVCIESVRNHPRYFVNHPQCGPNLVCGEIRGTCNSLCPAPSEADR